MSEVSVKAAWFAYRKDAPTQDLEGLLHGIAEGRRPYGPTVKKIYSFIDVNKSVQLFYCQNPGEEELVLSSPYAKQRELVYIDGQISSLPSYLQQEFDKLRDKIRKEEAESDERIVPYIPSQLGTNIQARLQALQWDLAQQCILTFNFKDLPTADRLLFFRAELTRDGFNCSLGSGSYRGDWGIKAEQLLQPDVNALNAMGDKLSALARMNLGRLDSCSLKQLPKISLKWSMLKLRWGRSGSRAHAATILAASRNAETIEALIGALSDRDSWVRMKVIQALCELANARAVDALIAALADHPKEVSTALGRIGDRRALEPLMRILAGKGHGREEAAMAVGMIGDGRAAKVLVQAAKNDPDDHVRIKALDAFNTTREPSMVSSLIELLNDRELGRTAREALIQLSGATGLVWMRPDHMDEEQLSTLRNELFSGLKYGDRLEYVLLAQALANIGDSRGEEWLAAAQSNHKFSDEVRTFAALALANRQFRSR